MQTPARKRVWKRVVLYALLLATLWAMLRWFEQHQVYFPSRRIEWTPRASGWRFEDVRLTASDGVALHGWFIPAPTNSPRATWTVLLLHGNAGNISHRFSLCDFFRRLGVNVFALDYRGYGLSAGRPSEAGTYRDAEAAYHWLTQQGFADTNLIAYGESLGGGVAAELALRQTLGGLVLQSTFTSIPEVGAELFPWLPVRWLSRISYDTHAKLGRIRAPVLILHSRGDTLVRFHHAEENFAAANDPKLLCEIAGDHNDALASLEGEERMRAGLEKFLSLLLTNGAPKSAPAR
ncbi:MAG: alpha/beta hydrolase [Verrucomicrobia bacterium]|nr:alpha/beta hydrolase [Verrucomicrobiota bacterium]